MLALQWLADMARHGATRLSLKLTTSHRVGSTRREYLLDHLDSKAAIAHENAVITACLHIDQQARTRPRPEAAEPAGPDRTPASSLGSSAYHDVGTSLVGAVGASAAERPAP